MVGIENLSGNTFTSHIYYCEGTELVAMDESKVEHVVKVTAVGKWGILWKHVVKIIDKQFENLY